MTRQEKEDFISGITTEINESPVIYLADVAELNAETTSQLRRLCFSRDIKLRVVKNTLLKRALDNAEADYSEFDSILVGNTSIMFSETGSAPAKVIKDFRKKADKPVLKGAYIEEMIYLGDDQVDFLSAIKSREELIGDIVMLLQSPAKNVVSALQSGGNKLSGLVKALGERAE